MSNTSNFLPDIYKISDTINEIQKKFMEDSSEDTLMMGIYGYLNEVHSNIMQNSIIMASEWGNEAFPIRAKFEKSIITNAITYNINDINAVPARMEVMIGFIEKELHEQMKNDVFIFDKDCKIMVGDFEFHIDYDIIINKDNVNNETVYAARYDIGRLNPLSDIENPYLAPPITLDVNNDRFIFINCIIRQVEITTIYKKIISSNILDNKTFDFEFENQLATFDIFIKEGKKEQYLTPIFEGMPNMGNDNYCFYNYLDNKTIRVKFDRNSYEPKLNCEVEIHVKTTQGSAGVFKYKDDIINGLESDKYNYGNLFILIKPVSSSEYGIDRKSIKDLKHIIPKEILSRGNITNHKDIENYFNMIDNNRLLFYRRRDNQFERLYYAYMLVKDDMNNVIPTNTIDLEIDIDEFDTMNDGRYMLNPGNLIEYKGNDICKINNSLKDDDIYDIESRGFIYSCPYLCVVNRNPLSVSYYLNILNDIYYFRFSYINKNSSLQFISTSLLVSKPYLQSDKYTLTMEAIQNMNIEKELIELDKDGNIVSCKIKPILIIHADNDYNYYIIGEVYEYDPDTFKYKIRFELKTSNIIDKMNRIKINDIYMGGTSNMSYVYLDESVKMSINMLVEFDEEYGRNEIDTIVPGLKGYTLCNTYDVPSRVNLFYNYSNIIKSTVKLIQKEDKSGYFFKIKGIPSVKFSYLDDKDRCEKFIEYVQYRKVYIDDAVKVLEDSFNIDFKFFNTYGISKMFKIGHDKESLDKVNLKLRFKLKLKVGASKFTRDYVLEEIKDYIENINTIESIHMSNLTTYILNKFKEDIEFIEFLGINNYNALYQYIEKVETEIIEDVPEFLNINLTKDLKPDIDIILV
ncbi:MAG: hypothetical protein ACRDD7_01225 [Peptostreptococcaceae bacterium]